jgi:hypothetical protein
MGCKTQKLLISLSWKTQNSGATTFRATTLVVTTLSTTIKLKHSAKYLYFYIVPPFWRHDTQHNDIQHYDIHYIQKWHATRSITTLSIMADNCYAECHLCRVSNISPLCPVPLCQMSLCWVSWCLLFHLYAVCRYSKCRFTECRGTWTVIILRKTEIRNFHFVTIKCL